MKNSLQNLLIFLALCLCGLVAFQWHREIALRQDLKSASEEARGKTAAIQSLRADLETADGEVKRLGSLRSGYAEIAESNRIEIASLKKQIHKAQGEIEQDAKQIEVFKAALQQANDNIQRQNESLKKLAEERNEAVVKFNDLVARYNELVERWNALPAAITNSSSKK